MNLLLKHGVRISVEYVRSGDLQRARALSNPDLSPHVFFVDMGGHGYAVVHATSDGFEKEFVCIPCRRAGRLVGPFGHHGNSVSHYSKHCDSGDQ